MNPHIYKDQKCLIESCNRKPKGRGLCTPHYSWIKRSGRIEEFPTQRVINKDKTCTHSTCSLKVKSGGFCSAHYEQFKRTHETWDIGTRPVGPKKMNPEDKLPQIDSSGYRRIHKPDYPHSYKDGFVLEHRYIMSEHLGRPLYDHEVVHYLNGDKTDNRIENLELWSNAHPSGQRPKDLVKFALEFIRQYEPEKLDRWLEENVQ